MWELYSCFVGSSSYQSKAVTVAKENSYFPLKTFVTFESANPQQIIGMYVFTIVVSCRQIYLSKIFMCKMQVSDEIFYYIDNWAISKVILGK
jgi:hypothetical protein